MYVMCIFTDMNKTTLLRNTPYFDLEIRLLFATLNININIILMYVHIVSNIYIFIKYIYY